MSLILLTAIGKGRFYACAVSYVSPSVPSYCLRRNKGLFSYLALFLSHSLLFMVI